MAPVLSSNWKKLQAQLNAATPTEDSPNRLKRKSTDLSKGPSGKKQKKSSTSTSNSTSTSTLSLAPRAAKAKARPGAAVPMGVTQSSKMEEPGVKSGASLATWAEENDISPESLAEAYGLGLKDNSMLTSEKEKVNAGLAEGLEVGKYIAMDCEMVGVGDRGFESALARVSIADFHGRQVYDSYVKPKERVTDWRTAVSGVAPKHMRFARDFDEVQAQVAELLKDRILVGHDVKHDLDALKLTHPGRDTRDTSKFPGFRQYGNGRKPALAKLAQEILGVEIQKGAHSSIEDAKVSMVLFRKHKSAFDVDNSNRFSSSTESSKVKPRPRKPKKKRK